jgi:hypothetical protein
MNTTGSAVSARRAGQASTAAFPSATLLVSMESAYGQMCVFVKPVGRVISASWACALSVHMESVQRLRYVSVSMAIRAYRVTYQSVYLSVSMGPVLYRILVNVMRGGQDVFVTRPSVKVHVGTMVTVLGLKFVSAIHPGTQAMSFQNVTRKTP